jgi:hypothetical protein
MRKGGTALAIMALLTAAGCSSGGGLSGGGAGVSPGHGSPRAAVDGFLTDLQSSGTLWCDYVDPTDQQDCRAGAAEVQLHITGTFVIGKQVVQGNEALVAVTGDLCVHEGTGSATTTSCSSNTDASAGLPPQAGSFSEAYAAATSTSGATTAPCIEVDALWYVNISNIGGSSTPATTTPTTTATTIPTTTPTTSTPASTTPTTTTATTIPATTTTTSTAP